MSEAVTLELPEEVMHQAREVAQRTGRQMADVLTEWLRWGAASEVATLLVHGSDYPIYTPYGNESLAQDLLDALSADGTTDGSGKTPR